MNSEEWPKNFRSMNALGQTVRSSTQPRTSLTLCHSLALTVISRWSSRESRRCVCREEEEFTLNLGSSITVKKCRYYLSSARCLYVCIWIVCGYFDCSHTLHLQVCNIGIIFLICDCLTRIAPITTYDNLEKVIIRSCIFAKDLYI